MTFLGSLPVMKNPPISTFSPCSTFNRVEMFNGCDAGVGVAVGVALGVAVGVALAVAVGVGVAVVPGVGVGVGCASTVIVKVCAGEVFWPPFAVPPLSCNCTVTDAVPVLLLAGV